VTNNVKVYKASLNTLNSPPARNENYKTINTYMETFCS